MSLVELHAGAGTPAYLIHGLDGLVFGFRELAAYLGRARRCVGLAARGIDGAREPLDCVEAIAAAYIDDIASAGAPERWLVAGWSFGGLVAFELGAQLTRAGARAQVAILDCRALVEPGADCTATTAAPGGELAAPGPDHRVVAQLRATQRAHAAARARYRPSRSRAPLLVVRAAAEPGPADPSLGFAALCEAPVETVALPTGHTGLLRAPNAEVVSERLEAFWTRQDQP